MTGSTRLFPFKTRETVAMLTCAAAAISRSPVFVVEGIVFFMFSRRLVTISKSPFSDTQFTMHHCEIFLNYRIKLLIGQARPVFGFLAKPRMAPQDSCAAISIAKSCRTWEIFLTMNGAVN